MSERRINPTTTVFPPIDQAHLQAELFATAGSTPLGDAVKEIVLDVLNRYRETIVDGANKAVNVPILSESVERKLIDAAYGAILDGIEAAL